MAERKSDFALPTLDDLFSTQQELVLIGDPAAIPILPGRHYQQALLFQTGHGGADRVLAQTAPLLYGGVTDGRCAQAVLAVR